MRIAFRVIKFFFIGICLFLITCRADKSPTKNSYYDINVPQINQNNFSNQLLFKSITNLETNKESIFREPTKVLINHHKLFVYDRSLQRILLFDTNGSFLGKLDNKGRGPNEYIDLRDFQIINNLIAILTFDKVMYYDLNFQLVDVYKIGVSNDQKYYINPTQFYKIKDTYYLWNGTVGIEYNKERMPFLMYSGSQGKILKGYFPLTHKLIGTNRFSAFNNRILITPVIDNDTIYSIVDDKLKIAYKIDFGEHNLPKNYIREYEDTQKAANSDYYININNLIETPKYLYFQFSHRGISMQGLFSKSTGQCVTGVLNPFTKIICADDDCLIAIADPVQLEYSARNIDKLNISTELKDVFRKLYFNIHDNPVKIQYSIKTF